MKMEGTIVGLSCGEKITVYPVPPFVFSNIEATHPLPQGVDSAELARAAVLRDQLIQDTAFLLALKDISVPADWKFPEVLQYANLHPREGEAGRKLDYIEYELLLTPEDVTQVTAAMYGGALTEAEIGAAEAVFPGHS